MSGYTHVMYALHALAGFIGVTSGASIVGAFVFGLPSIIAILMNYARRDAVRGSFLESHFLWQSKTFWTAVVLGLALFCIALLLSAVGVVSLMTTPLTGAAGAAGAGVGFGGALVALTLGAMLAGIWILYRVVRGWMALGSGKTMHA
ncbi:MAG TPA: hypothetical protein VFU13_18310 [Steroidobacteraceae bacterium]|nr:hypothetical protein [Steroidobacteraceae bacterium]